MDYEGPVKAGERYGEWVTVRAIGSGSMGSVWLAHRDRDDQPGALKLLHGNHDASDHERFGREIEVLGHLEHPFLVRLLDAGEHDATPWMVMEYVAGDSLEVRLAAGQALSVDEALTLFGGMADGLRHAHARGIHHRDIKAANVVIAADASSAKLVDFGVALKQGASRLTTQGLVMGTFAYMPPEVVEGAERDPVLGDIYALGQLLHESLTGQLAFRGDPDEDNPRNRWVGLMTAKVEAPALDPGAEVPEALRQLVRAATTPQPDARIQTMAELADGLLRVRGASPELRNPMNEAGGEAVATRPTGGLPFSPLWLGLIAVLGFSAIIMVSICAGLVSGLLVVGLL